MRGFLYFFILMAIIFLVASASFMHESIIMFQPQCNTLEKCVFNDKGILVYDNKELTQCKGKPGYEYECMWLDPLKECPVAYYCRDDASENYYNSSSNFLIASVVCCVLAVATRNIKLE